MRKTTTTLLVASGIALAPAASAHLTLNNPPARHPASDLKDGPCGVGPDDARTTDPAKITTYVAGETITVEWTEVIDHDPAHYRITFSSEGDAFTDPTGFDDIETIYPELLDGIPDADDGAGHVYSVEVTLPDEPCDSCSLQVIQVMHDKPPWGPGGGDDIYYQCADIVILEDPNALDPIDPDPVDPLPTGDGGAPTAGATGGSMGLDGSGGAVGAGGQFGSPAAGGADAFPTAAGGSAEPPPPGSESQSDSSGGGEEAAANCALHPGGDSRSWFWAILFAAGGVLRVRRRQTLS